MRVIQFLMIIALILGASFYVFFRIWHLVPPFPYSRAIIIAAGILLTLAPFIALALQSRLPYGVSSSLYNIGTSWLIIFLYLLMAFLSLDILRLVGVTPLKAYMFNSWTGLVVIFVAVAAIMSVGNIRYNNKKRVELDLAVNKSFEPIKIVAASDLHLGYTIGNKELSHWVDMINAEKPDIVLLAGDVIDNGVRPVEHKNMTDVLRKIDAKYGVYACLGNHEYITGLEKAVPVIEAGGIKVLRDSAVLVNDSFYIVGRDDRTNRNRADIAALTDTLDKSKPIIMIDHQPYDLQNAERAGVDLEIFGHTHGGQVWPLSLITNAIYEVSNGYLKKGEANIYVSSGLGIWGGKFRIGSRSEYIVVELLPAGTKAGL